MHFFFKIAKKGLIFIYTLLVHLLKFETVKTITSKTEKKMFYQVRYNQIERNEYTCKEERSSLKSQ